MSDLLVGALSALLASNTPMALSNLVHDRTGIAVPVSNPDDPIEKEYRRIMILDDDAESVVDEWIRKNHELTAKGQGVPAVELNAKIKVRFDEVKREYETFIQAHPKHARAHLAYGGFLSDIGEDERALKHWDIARELDPNNPVPWNNLANYYGHNGPVTNAFACYAKAVECKPRESLYYQNFATTVFLFRKDAMDYFHISEPEVFEKAMGLYRKARELDPNNFLLATDLAQSYYGIKMSKSAGEMINKKLVDEALAAWRDAFRIAPDENARQGIYVHFVRWQIDGQMYSDARSTMERITNNAFLGTRRALEKKLAKQEAGGTNSSPAAVSPLK